MASDVRRRPNTIYVVPTDRGIILFIVTSERSFFSRRVSSYFRDAQADDESSAYQTIPGGVLRVLQTLSTKGYCQLMNFTPTTLDSPGAILVGLLNVRGFIVKKRWGAAWVIIRPSHSMGRLTAAAIPALHLLAPPPSGGYEPKVYTTRNICGYTGDIDDRPTVYFASSSGRFGHITQKHNHRQNIGRGLPNAAGVPYFAFTRAPRLGTRRERTRRMAPYLVEFAGGSRHPSRNPFVQLASPADPVVLEKLAKALWLHQHAKQKLTHIADRGLKRDRGGGRHGEWFLPSLNANLRLPSSHRISSTGRVCDAACPTCSVICQETFACASLQGAPVSRPHYCLTCKRRY